MEDFGTEVFFTKSEFEADGMTEISAIEQTVFGGFACQSVRHRIGDDDKMAFVVTRKLPDGNVWQYAKNYDFPYECDESVLSDVFAEDVASSIARWKKKLGL